MSTTVPIYDTEGNPTPVTVRVRKDGVIHKSDRGKFEKAGAKPAPKSVPKADRVKSASPKKN